MNHIGLFAEFLEAMSGRFLLNCAIVGGLFLIASLIAKAWNNSGKIDRDATEEHRKDDE